MENDKVFFQSLFDMNEPDMDETMYGGNRTEDDFYDKLLSTKKFDGGSVTSFIDSLFASKQNNDYSENTLNFVNDEEYYSDEISGGKESENDYMVYSFSKTDKLQNDIQKIFGPMFYSLDELVIVRNGFDINEKELVNAIKDVGYVACLGKPVADIKLVTSNTVSKKSGTSIETVKANTGESIKTIRESITKTGEKIKEKGQQIGYDIKEKVNSMKGGENIMQIQYLTTDLQGKGEFAMVVHKGKVMYVQNI